MSLALASPAQSRIEIGAWTLRKSNWTAVAPIAWCHPFPEFPFTSYQPLAHAASRWEVRLASGLSR